MPHEAASRKFAAFAGHRRPREKRGIRRDAARHCQTAPSLAESVDFAQAKMDKPGDSPVDKFVVRRKIKMPCGASDDFGL